MLPIVFLSIAALSFALFNFVSRPSKRARKSARRLLELTALADFQVRGAQNRERQAIAAKKIEAFIQKTALNSALTKMLLQARVKLKAADFIMVCLLVCALAFLLAGLIGQSLMVGMAGGLLGLFLPVLWLRRKRAKRIKAFSDGLPNAIEIIARAMRAGHSVQQAMEVVADQSRDPIREEFAQVHQEQRLGIPFREALTGMGDRVPLQDLRFLITAALVQKETGGDLIQILERTAHTIRERLRVQGEIKTYTAQGRATGWVLTVLPMALLGIISLIIPGYATILFTDPVGRMMLGAGVFMLILGGLTIRSIVNIEV